MDILRPVHHLFSHHLDSWKQLSMDYILGNTVESILNCQKLIIAWWMSKRMSLFLENA